MSAQLIYDGDGRRVKSEITSNLGTTTTYFIGAYYEVTDPGTLQQTVTKYYFAGAQRVAMRKYTVPSSMAVEYFLGDHPSPPLRTSLGSTSITTDANGAKVSEMRYKPWGEVRYSWTAGQSTTPAYLLPNYTFTSQFSYMDDPSTAWVTEGFGLLFYVSRFYDPYLNHFTQADSIVPGGVQGLDRYAYVNNSPINYTDPSGHYVPCEADAGECQHDDPPSSGGGGSGGNGNDPVQLTTVGERGSGLQMQQTYNRLVSMCGANDPAAWWCSSSGTFTLYDFMIIVMSSELSPLGEVIVDSITGATKANDPAIQAKLTEAAANWFSESCLAHPPCKGATPNAILNWLGENFESAQRLFPETANPTYHPNMTGLATAVVNAVLSVGSTPKSGGTWGLVHWGNRSYYEATYGDGHVPTANYMILGGKDPAYVIPYGEERRLACGSPFC